MKIFIISLLALTILPSSATFAADATAGQQKAGACFGCHGAEGNSTISANPILAGQQALYLANQLKGFRENRRVNPIMAAITKNLSDSDINDLAAYFSSRKTKSAGGDSSLAKQGATKANQCYGCHGSNAKGQGAFPKLAGQHPAYLIQQLHNFKSGARQGGPMKAVAANLIDSDMEQLANYMATLE